MRGGGLFAMLRRLRANRSGVSVLEFALSLPFLMLMGVGGIEIANMWVVSMRINQIAVSLADNASRMKQQSVSGAPKFTEYDVNEAFEAAKRQGADLDIVTNGRVILTSLETNASGGQWFHWQRCLGAKTAYTSAWGPQDTGKTGTAFTGVTGPTGTKVTAEAGTAIMVAEIVYEYKPLFVDKLYDTATIRKSSAMYVRDDRDLTQIYASPGITAATC